MKGTLNSIIVFAVGAAIGSAVTCKLLKEKYEKMADDEIESMREYFSKKEVNSKSEKIDKAPDTDEEIYEHIVKDYSTLSTERQKEKKEETIMDKPCIITPDEFGENEEYECISLTYYADNVLTDEYDEPMDYVDATVGSDYMKHFGENENDEDSVYVRNDKTKCYYEILKDQTRYRDRFRSGE